MIVALLAVFLLVLPKMGEVSTTEDELHAAEDQEFTLAAQLNALQDAQAAAPETEQEIAAIDAAIPPIADLPSLFRLLQGAADRSAVDFFSFTPGTPVPNAAGTFSTHRLAGHGERRVLRDRRVPVPARDAAAGREGHDARGDAVGGRDRRDHDEPRPATCNSR